MTFTSKKVSSKANSMTLIKGATLFFLGMSCIFFVARAFEIVPSVPNTVQYIKSIYLTTDGSTTNTRIVLDGSQGNGNFSGTLKATNIQAATITGTTICLATDTSGIKCRTQWPVGSVGGESLWSTGTNGAIYYNGGDVGIGTNTPTEKIQISDFAWIGTGSSIENGGSFLRLFAIDKLSVAGYNYPNIQLNYGYDDDINDEYYDIENWKIFNDSNLNFQYNGLSPAIKITSEGKVGIGTNPTAALTVSGDIKLQNSGRINAGTNTMQLRIAANGNVGIGLTNPSTKLDVDGIVTATSYLYNSDKRLKTDITSITNPLQKILALNGYLFTWKKTGTKDMGVIAQEVEKVFPEIVHTNNEGYKSVEYGNLVAPLIEAIKALNTKIDNQAKEIAALKAK